MIAGLPILVVDIEVCDYFLISTFVEEICEQLAPLILHEA